MMQYKTRPYKAVSEAKEWVSSERKKKGEREGKVPPDKDSGKGKEGEKKADEMRDRDQGETSIRTPSLWWTFGGL